MYFNPIYIILAILGIPLALYSIYYFILSLFGLFKYESFEKTEPKNKLAAVIAARNEGSVIGLLIDSIKKTNYPEELLDVWVIPNNCTDNTEEIAREHGAKIYNPKLAVHSKGDALKEFFEYSIEENDIYDAFCIFDADNLVDADFFNRMNDVVESGELVAQGYRESKNPKDSWISGSQTIFYWITNRFLNCSRRNLKMSAVLNGTGFMVTSKLIKEMGFDTFTMTEDIEYSTQCLLRGHRIAFASKAIVYDEHPTDFDVSWNQRKRWSTGIIQVLYGYSEQLYKKYKETKDWIYMDMIIYLVAPYFQVISTIYTFFCLTIYGIITFFCGYAEIIFLFSFISYILGIFGTVALTVFTTLYDKHKIKQCLNRTYIAFWYFIFSWFFINIEVFFKPQTTWDPIEHKKSISINELDLQPIRAHE